MALRDRAAAREETIGEPAQGEHLKSPALDRQSTGLSDRFGASLEHRDAHFCQSKLTGDPQPDRTSANHNGIEFIAHNQRSVHLQKSVGIVRTEQVSWNIASKEAFVRRHTLTSR